MRQRVLPSPRLEGTVVLPGDKSISHRSAILNALAQGTATVRNYSPGADCTSTLRCLRALGVRIQQEGAAPGTLVIEGANHRLQEPAQVLNCGNSGTTLRLLSGVLASQPFLSILTGDASLRSRPMARIIAPLQQMGASIQGRKGNTLPPLVIRGGPLSGIEYQMPVASAQLKSCLLLAGLLASGTTVVHELAPSRDHTEQMLRVMGARIDLRGRSAAVRASELQATDIRVPGDISAAAFWLVAAAAHPNARLRIQGVGLNPTRTGVLDVLKAMGAVITVSSGPEEGGEPTGDLVVESSELRATEISGELVPNVQDEIPVLAVAACFARGTTTIRNAEELRVKESDRIHTTVTELRHMGADIEELKDGMLIRGPVKLNGGACRGYRDHRLVMALAVAGLLAQGETVIEGGEHADVSYPGFWEQLHALTRIGQA
ncbi:MAG: 3-phosphoshikimate 1-carboxyvinyltransferase [Dehalococcoidia bacterium]|nr:3-phosphoshikimate 1-carboxyvinyltransferase [Dehalococcoidia bacterium]